MNNNVAEADRNKYVLYETADDKATVDYMGRIIARSEPKEVARLGVPADPPEAPEAEKLGPPSEAGEVYPLEMNERNAGTGTEEEHDQLAEDRANYDREISASLRRLR